MKAKLHIYGSDRLGKEDMRVLRALITRWSASTDAPVSSWRLLYDTGIEIEGSSVETIEELRQLLEYEYGGTVAATLRSSTIELFTMQRAKVYLPTNDQPPELGQYLLWYLPRKDREAIEGDLEEEFREVHDRFGRRKAVAWYYFQVGASFWPYAVRTGQKLLKWGVLGAVGGVIRRFIP